MPSSDRPLAVFVSDIHLTDTLAGASVPKEDVFERFWTRIEVARGKRPATLSFVGDLFDIVRSPSWFETSARTWRSVHQIGHGVGGRPTFLPYDAMSYLVFFPDGDALGRDFEWWNGALVSRKAHGA